MNRAARQALSEARKNVRVHGLAPLERIRVSMPKNMSGPAYGQWLKRQAEVTREVKARLEAEGAHIVFTGHTAKVNFGGHRAGSSMGLRQALLNWKAGAEKRLGIT